MLSEVCKDVRIERVLQQLKCEIFSDKIIMENDEASSDISVLDFLSMGQVTILDIKDFYGSGTRYVNQSITKTYEMNK